MIWIEVIGLWVDVHKYRGGTQQGNDFRMFPQPLGIAGRRSLAEFDFFGKNLELMQKGAGYDSIKVKGNLQKGKFMMEEVVMEAPWMKMVSQGEVDLINQKIDLTLILAPLTTVDKIISYIPIVGNILGDDFISIPVRVRGDLNDPKIIPLPPSAIGEGLLGVMKRTLAFPFKLIQPVMPRSEEK